jgi:hypothetical protein
MAGLDPANHAISATARKQAALFEKSAQKLLLLQTPPLKLPLQRFLVRLTRRFSVPACTIPKRRAQGPPREARSRFFSGEHGEHGAAGQASTAP